MVAESKDDKSRDIRVLQHDGSNYIQWDASLRIALAQDDASVLLLQEYNMEVEGESYMTVEIKRRMLHDIEAAETQLALLLKRIALKASQPHAKLEMMTPSMGSVPLTPVAPMNLTGKSKKQVHTNMSTSSSTSTQHGLDEDADKDADDETKTEDELITPTTTSPSQRAVAPRPQPPTTPAPMTDTARKLQTTKMLLKRRFEMKIKTIRKNAERIIARVKKEQAATNMQADRKAGSQYLNPSSGIDDETKELMEDIPDNTPPPYFRHKDLQGQVLNYELESSTFAAKRVKWDRLVRNSLKHVSHHLKQASCGNLYSLHAAISKQFDLRGRDDLIAKVDNDLNAIRKSPKETFQAFRTRFEVIVKNAEDLNYTLDRSRTIHYFKQALQESKDGSAFDILQMALTNVESDEKLRLSLTYKQLADKMLPMMVRAEKRTKSQPRESVAVKAAHVKDKGDGKPKDKRGESPCITFAEKGKCGKKNCPYQHRKMKGEELKKLKEYVQGKAEQRKKYLERKKQKDNDNGSNGQSNSKSNGQSNTTTPVMTFNTKEKVGDRIQALRDKGFTGEQILTIIEELNRA